MIKVNNIGMLNIAKNNPTVTSASEVSNYSFITSGDNTYLVANRGNGDFTYREGLTFAAGTKLNCYQVDAWKGQELIVDGKHISGGITSSIAVGTLLKVKSDGTLETTASAPTSGVYFKVTTIGIKLTESAVKVRVLVVDEVSSGT